MVAIRNLVAVVAAVGYSGATASILGRMGFGIGHGNVNGLAAREVTTTVTVYECATTSSSDSYGVLPPSSTVSTPIETTPIIASTEFTETQTPTTSATETPVSSTIETSTFTSSVTTSIGTGASTSDQSSTLVPGVPVTSVTSTPGVESTANPPTGSTSSTGASESSTTASVVSSTHATTATSRSTTSPSPTVSIPPAVNAANSNALNYGLVVLVAMGAIF